MLNECIFSSHTHLKLSTSKIKIISLDFLFCLKKNILLPCALQVDGITTNSSQTESWVSKPLAQPSSVDSSYEIYSPSSILTAQVLVINIPHLDYFIHPITEKFNIARGIL